MSDPNVTMRCALVSLLLCVSPSDVRAQVSAPPDHPVGTRLRFSPDGRLLASFGCNTPTVLWDAIRWRSVVTIPVYSTTLAFSHDSRRVAVSVYERSGHGQRTGMGDASGAIRIFDAQSGRVIDTWHVWAAKQIQSIDFSSDGRFLAHTTGRGGIDLRRASDGRILRTIPSNPHFIRFSPDGNRLAGSFGGSRISIWTMPDGSMQSTTPSLRQQARIQRFCWAPDGNRLATSAVWRSGEVWDLQRDQRVFEVPCHMGNPGIAWSPDGRFVASGATNGAVAIQRADEVGTIVTSFRAAPESASGLAFSPDSRWLVTAGDGRDMIVRDTTHWDVVKALKLQFSQLTIETVTLPEGQ